MRRFRRKPATSPGRPPRWAVQARPFVGPRAQGAAGSGKGFRCPRRPPSCFVGPGVRQEPHGRRWRRRGSSASTASVGGRRRAGDGGGGPATATAGRVIQTWTHQPTRTYRRVRYSQRVDTSRSGSIRPRPNSSWGETRRVTAASICAPLHTRCARPLTLARARGPSVGSLPGSVGLIRLGQPPSPS